MNSAARLMFFYRGMTTSRRSSVSCELTSLYCDRAAERIDFELAVLVYKCLHGAALSYLADELCLSADLSPRCCFHSAPSSSLVVRRMHLSTIGDRALPVAATHVEQSTAACNICILSACISQTSENSPVSALLPLTACVMPEQ